MEFAEKLRLLRESRNYTQEQFSAILGVKRGAYSAYESGRVKLSTELLQKVATHFQVPLEDLISEAPPVFKPYIEQRREQKIGGNNGSKFPAYVGNTKLGNLEVYSYNDDPEMQHPVGYFDATLFPGCDHAEKVSGSSMYPLIVSQGWVIGKIIDKKGMISGEKYLLHTRYKENVVKYVQPSEKSDRYIKLISHNKKIPDQDLRLDDVTFCMRVYFIINPA